MGVLTDVVIADEGEAEAVATERVPAKRWRGIDAKGIDQVKLATLWARLAQRGLDVESIVKLTTDFATLFEVSEGGPLGLPHPWPPGGAAGRSRRPACCDDGRRVGVDRRIRVGPLGFRRRALDPR